MSGVALLEVRPGGSAAGDRAGLLRPLVAGLLFCAASAQAAGPGEPRLGADAPQAAPVSIGIPEPVPSGLANVAEFRFDLGAGYGNPYDPDEIRVDADVAGPGGRNWVVPAFWFEPVSRTNGPVTPDFSRVTKLRLFVDSRSFKAGASVEFAVDAIELFNSKTGASRVIDDFEGDLRWYPGTGAGVSRNADQPRAGKTSLLVSIVNPRERTWPGANLDLPGENWSAFDTLRLSWRPRRGLENASVWVEFVTAGQIVQTALSNSAPVYAESRWRDFSWRFDKPSSPASIWSAPGSGSWRLRLAIPESGSYTLRLRAEAPGSRAESVPAVFQLERVDPDGFIRVDSRSGRFFRFDSGKPYVAIGTNLVAAGPGAYGYYLPKFAAAGVNLARIWMSASTLGIERVRPTEYDQQRAAALDSIVNLSAGLGVRLMICLTDFREALGGARGSWGKTAYTRLSPVPAGFFTSLPAARAYRKRLRYIVARWSASTTVQSWELFNEADLTSAWEEQPGSVRDWHLAMAGYLREMDPYRHLVTTSLSGREDDELWRSAEMQIVQRHTYLGRPADLAGHLNSAVRTLAAHGKPVLVGEFGTHVGNLYGESDPGGLGLHEGLWAPLFAGAAGSGIPWFWEWIDQHELYPRFAALSEFVRGIVWPEEGFSAVAPADLEAAWNVPETGAPPGRVVLILAPGSFVPAPVNQPVRVRILRDGTLEPPNLVSRIVHGIGHHPGHHNPQTYDVDYPAAGEFAVCVGEVSGAGGAALKMTLDGQPAFERRFEDPDGMKSMENLSAYGGCYRVGVPAGAHTVVLENTGMDWFTLQAVTLTNYGRRPVRIELAAARSRDAVILWARNSSFSWPAPLLEQSPVPARDVAATVRGVTPGAYLVEVFDPQSGRWLERRQVASAGALQLPLGEIAGDIMVRCSRI